MNFQNHGKQSKPVLTAFLNTIPRALAADDPSAFGAIFNTSPFVFSSQPLQALRNELLGPKNVADAVRSTVETILTDEWLSLNEAVIAYLEYIAACDPSITHGDEPPYPQQQQQLLELTIEWYTKMHSFLSALATAFNSARGGVLSHAIKSAVKNTINTANHCDHYKNDIHRPYTSGLLNTVVKTFNSSLAERTLYDAAGLPKLGKKAAMLDLANCLFRLYLKLREHRIVTTIFDNLSACGVPLEVPHFPRATLVTYHYYRGLHNLHNAAFLTSHAALTKSYALCSHRFTAQRRRILVPLMSVSLILGLIPHPDLFARPESAELRDLFTPIYIAIRRGDFRTFRQAMGIEDAPGEDTSWRQAFWLKHHVYYALCHRLQPQLWRGLLRRVALLRESGGPLMLGDVAVCARYLHLKTPVATQAQNPLFHGQEPEDQVVRGEVDENSWFMDGLTLTVADVEAAVESVLDQGFVKGYLARLEGGPVLVLSKQEPFPKVWSVFEGARWATEEQAAAAPEEGGGRVVRLSGVKGIGEK